jgi:hypothetical protein
MTSKTNKEYLQYQVLDIISNQIKKGLLHNTSRRPGFGKENLFYEKFKGIDKKSLPYKIFNNFRIKNGEPQGLKLSYLGNEICKRNFEFWEFDHSIIPTPKMYLVLDNQMNWPYYFTKKKMVLYNKEDASWYKINGSDIESFIEII